jgi:FkbH-like protein
VINTGIKPLTYLEARKFIEKNKSTATLEVTLCMSGTAEPLLPFIQGEIARFGFSPKINFLPYGTLLQHLNTKNANTKPNELWLVFPWDLVPNTDWRIRSGAFDASIDTYIEQATMQIDKICDREPINLVFIDAPIPPVGIDASNAETLKTFFKFYLNKVGARIVGDKVFSLQKYLTTGFPFEGASLGIIAQNLMEHLVNKDDPKKVLITDFDNTFWSGVAAEDGPSGIEMRPEGSGYKHYIYQNYLSQLQGLGVVVAAVTRNSDSIVDDIFDHANPSFKKEQFSAIVASYESKSAQIQEIADVMNLGLDSFVFIDDNPIEIHEVSNALPKVVAIHFPDDVEQIPSFINKLSHLFSRKNVTKEDRGRTEKYKLMLSGLKAKKASSNDLGAFLKSLEMKLHIENRTLGDWERAIQLINKTNQFNSNGLRLSDQYFKSVLEDGGRIYTARLTDSGGDHGEILACLIDSSNVIISLVMSCRVFQRNVEHVFLYWLFSHMQLDEILLRIKKTNRNEPFFNFLDGLDSCSACEDEVRLNAEKIQKSLAHSMNIIEVINGC